MKIENLKVSELVPYEKNPRRNDTAVESVAESIKQFGFQQPIVIDSQNIIIAGHTRLKAAKKLGLSFVPCVRAEELTPEQVKAYRILDNKTNELAGWDFNALAEELNSFEFDFEPFAVNLPKFVDDVFETNSAPYGTASAGAGYYDDGAEEEVNEDIEGGVEQPHQPRHVTAYDPSRKVGAPIPWLGSKARQAKNILPFFAKASDRLCYCEPFGGSGAIFCAKEPEDYEVYNDHNKNLTNLFRQLRRPETPEYFREMTINSPWGRGFWHDYRKLCMAFMEGDIEKQDALIEEVGYTNIPREIVWAFAFFYCQNLGFGGVPLGSFGYGSKGKRGRDAWKNRLAQLEWYQGRFYNVLVEEIDCFECLDKYDSSTTLFYLDPPYDVDCSDKYESGWTKDSTQYLVDILCSIRGRAVVSCYDNEIYEKLFSAGYKREKFEAQMSVCRTKREPRIETVYYRL